MKRRGSVKGDAISVDMKKEMEADHEGFLEKFSNSKKWQKRYFEIAGDYLRYYPDAKKNIAKLKGGMDLNTLVGCRMVAAIGGGYEIVMEFEESTYQLRADNEKLGQEWLDKFLVFKEKNANKPKKEDDKDEKGEEDKGKEGEAKEDGEKKEGEDGGDKADDEKEGEDKADDEKAGKGIAALKVVIEGKMSKWKTGRKFEQKFFQIRGKYLIYYPDETKDDMKGMVALELAQLSEVKMAVSFNGFEILARANQLCHLQCAEKDVAENWMKELTIILDENMKDAKNAEGFFSQAINGKRYEATLIKNDKGLGISLEGVEHGAHEIVIIDGFVEGTIAHQLHLEKKLMIGDVLLEVAGHSAVDIEFNEMTEFFQGDEIQIVVSRSDASEEEIAQNMAALKMQKMQRGRLARKDLIEQKQAATKLAAIQRGRMDRKKAEDIRAELDGGD
jgi:hypothetical protein